jgi:hypothetical protein
MDGTRGVWLFVVRVGSILSIKVFQIARQKCMWFSLGRLIFKKSSKPNQCGYGWFDRCGLEKNDPYDSN